MENKDFIEDSELRIAICDDDKSDREKVHVLLQDYLKKNSIKAQVRIFDHPDTLIRAYYRILQDMAGLLYKRCISG